MKVVYYSKPFFADADFPLIREFQQKGIEIYYILDLAPFSKKSTLIDIKEQIQESAIIKAERYAEFNEYKDYLNLDNVYIVNRLKSSVLDSDNIHLAFQLFKMIKKIKPDIIHCITPPDCMETLLYWFRKKMVLTVHDPFPHSGEQSKRREFFRKLAMKFCSKFVLLNKNQKELFQQKYNISEKRIEINQMGAFSCINCFRVQLPQSRKKNILFFGRISPYKGVEYLLEAMKHVHELIPDATLTIAGGGKLYFDYAPYENLDYIELRNHYIGMQELAQLLADSSVVVCPYTDATQSGVIMTAFSMCKPVIATNVGGLGEMVKDNINGYLIPPKDVIALTDSIVKILQDTSKYAELVHCIEDETFIGERAWNTIADKYIQCYSTIIRK